MSSNLNINPATTYGGVLDFNGDALVYNTGADPSVYESLQGNKKLEFKLWLDSSTFDPTGSFGQGIVDFAVEDASDYLGITGYGSTMRFYCNQEGAGGTENCVQIDIDDSFVGEILQFEVIKTRGPVNLDGSILSITINDELQSHSIRSGLGRGGSEARVGYFSSALQNGTVWDVKITDTDTDVLEHHWVGYPDGNTNTAWEDIGDGSTYDLILAGGGPYLTRDITGYSGGSSVTSMSNKLEFSPSSGKGELLLQGIVIETPILSFTTEASTLAFDPNMTVSSGILSWDLGDGTEKDSNSFSHNYTQVGNKTVKMYQGTTGGVSDVTGINLLQDDIVGNIDLSEFSEFTYLDLSYNYKLTSLELPTTNNNVITYFSIRDTSLSGTIDLSNYSNLGGQFQASGMRKVTSVLFPTSSQIFTAFNIPSCDLTGTLDVSGLSGIRSFAASFNPNLTTILAPVCSERLLFYSYECGLTGTLDVSGLTGLYLFDVNTNPNLTSVLNPETSEVMSGYRVYDCNITGTLDVTGLHNLGGEFRAYNNPNLNTILHTDSSHAISTYDVHSCGLIGTLDVSGLTGLGGFRCYGDSSLTEIINPVSSYPLNNYLAYSCDLTGTLDVSGLTALQGQFNVSTNPNLTTILNPPTSGSISSYYAWACGLTGTLDVRGLTLTGNFNLRDNTNLTEVLVSDSSLTSFAVYSCDLTGALDISTLNNLKSYFDVHNNPSLSEILFATQLGGQFSTFSVDDCSLNQTTIDTVFSLLNAWYSSNTPTINLTINADGGTNMPPTDGSSNSDILSLESIFSGAAKTLTININT